MSGFLEREGRCSYGGLRDGSLNQALERITAVTGRVEGVYVQPLVLEEPFMDFAARFAHRPGTVVLMSGGDLDCAQRHFLAIDPWLEVTARPGEFLLSARDRTERLSANPFDVLEALLAVYTVPPVSEPNLPGAAGLFGYLAYDLKDSLENLPRTSVDDLGLPYLYLMAPSIVVIHDLKDDRTVVALTRRKGRDQDSGKAALDDFQRIVQGPPARPGDFSADMARLGSGFTRAEYLETVQRVKEYIASGHVYQVNLSQRFETGFQGDAFALFARMYEMNPAPFFAFVRAGDHAVVSTSPERFMTLEGSRVETRPIKGTRPRGVDPEEDLRQKDELLQSKKDEAELSMIVDLLRNDIGKVCRAGSVRVTDHKRVEAYQNVYHLVSLVTGELREDQGPVDLVRAAFPGGSITGCPKIRAMEIIDELEPVRRHVYTGSIGYLGFDGRLDLSIAIRTAIIAHQRVYFSVGGGIVFDSDPEDEFQETLHKGRTLMEVFQGVGEDFPAQPRVWFNGKILPADQASVSASGLGLQYGHGFFETLRIEQGRPVLLAEHLKRFARSWRDLISEHPPDLTWEEIIRQVLDQNDLGQGPAAVKILAALKSRGPTRVKVDIMVSARPYTHRLEGKKDQGLHLLIYPEARQTPLADHKTLNYLYYLMAGEWAAQQGSDEALILNPDGSLSETNTANLLLIRGRTVFQPQSVHALPGITQAEAGRLLAQWGFQVTRTPIRPEKLFGMDEVLVTNSLMGAAPVLSVDGRPVGRPSDLWEKLNRAMWAFEPE